MGSSGTTKGSLTDELHWIFASRSERDELAPSLSEVQVRFSGLHGRWVTGYHESVQVLRTPACGSLSDIGRAPVPKGDGDSDLDFARRQTALTPWLPAELHDSMRHRVRTVLLKKGLETEFGAFTADRAEEHVRRLGDRQEFDLVADWAVPVVTDAVAWLLGVEPRDLDGLRDLALIALEGMSPAAGTRRKAAAAAALRGLGE